MNDKNIINTNQNGWSLKREDWMRLQSTLDDLNPDWYTVPLKRSLNSMIPNKSGIYIIEGTTPLSLFDGLEEYRTPLYVGLSDIDLQSRFNNHCQGRLPGVKQLVNTWNTSGLMFKYAVIEHQIDDRNIEDLLYDLESEFLMVFGPSANVRKQRPSYMKKYNVVG